MLGVDGPSSLLFLFYFFCLKSPFFIKQAIGCLLGFYSKLSHLAGKSKGLSKNLFFYSISSEIFQKKHKNLHKSSINPKSLKNK
jgi:hypothetical protein